MTPERQVEIKSRIDQRFDQFSLEEVQKVVSGEMTSRLAHPGFTMATYQHVLPGMSADAAYRVAELIHR